MFSDWWALDTWNQSPVMLVSWVFWVIASITLHELGHGWAAIRAGDTTPIDSGHMTWNPVVHMGLLSLAIFALIGLAWGMMPVNPDRMKGRYAELRVAAAGPAMNAGIAVALMLVLPFWSVFAGPLVGTLAYENVAVFLLIGAMLNVALLILNLLPIPPLDGARMISSVNPGFREFAYGQSGMIVGIVVLVAVFLFGVDLIFLAASETVGAVQEFAIGLLGGD